MFNIIFSQKSNLKPFRLTKGEKDTGIFQGSRDGNNNVIRIEIHRNIDNNMINNN